MKKGKPLTEDEAVILQCLKNLKLEQDCDASIPEADFHLMISIASVASGNKTYEFEMNKIWRHVDERYVWDMPSRYSSKLHDVIESLRIKGYIRRHPINPIMIDLV
jgi:hypothetical protein